VLRANCAETLPATRAHTPDISIVHLFFAESHEFSRRKKRLGLFLSPAAAIYDLALRPVYIFAHILTSPAHSRASIFLFRFASLPASLPACLPAYLPAASPAHASSKRIELGLLPLYVSNPSAITFYCDG
jgi:hypothetical protein